MPDFLQALVDAFQRARAYEHKNSLRMQNEFALSGTGAPIASNAHALAMHGVDLGRSPEGVKQAIIAMLATRFLHA